MVFIDPISNWITARFSNIDEDYKDSANELALSTGYIFFVLMSIINLPLLSQLVDRQVRPFTYSISFIMKYFIYEIIYFLLIILICILNPGGIITNTYAISYLMIGTILAFLCIKTIPNTIKEILIILSVIGLSIVSENAVRALWYDPTWQYILLYIAIYIVGYSFVLYIIPVSEIVHSVKTRAISIYRERPNISTILLVEIACIVLFFYMRSISKRYYGGTLIVHEPISLSKTSSYPINQVYNYEYTISCWMYMNATSSGYSQSSNEYTDVLLFGQELLLAYNSALNKVRVIMKHKQKKRVYDITHLPLQKWNNFALSYANGTFDIFMNGVLLKSSSIVPYSDTHDLIVGFENGVSGKLCNLLYFNEVISIEKIKDLYSQFHTKNPPIF
jgi:hypothetical protein